ncbi:MAG: hypothetical protein JNL74_03880, partial [Fibrobacteres bacterium]|nr:hypothetical protein [Fibrobacterota bacterium]
MQPCTINSTNYFVMVCEGKHPITPIRVCPHISGWMLGRVVEPPAKLPLHYELNSRHPGNPKAMYDEKSVPIMHDSVRAVLEWVGVSNIQYFDAVLSNPLSGEIRHDYKAFNIVGLVACADITASQTMGISSSRVGDTDFHGLVIDETKTDGTLLFRLAENISAIVVHK